VTEAEATIQAWLDDHPDDGWARQVLADHLDDEGDERAAGYRELGRLGRAPRNQPRGEYPAAWSWVRESNPWAWSMAFNSGELYENALPDEWVLFTGTSPAFNNTNAEAGWREWPTRREAEDAAALAYARLAVVPS
jgi:hypothetical protein